MGEQCITWQILLDRKSNVAMNTWLPQASYPCGNFSDTPSLKLLESKRSIDKTKMKNFMQETNMKNFMQETDYTYWLPCTLGSGDQMRVAFSTWKKQRFYMRRAIFTFMESTQLCSLEFNLEFNCNSEFSKS